MNKLNLHTANKADDNFIKLAELFPNAVTETMVDGVLTRAIDKDVLMQEISAQVVEGGEERYQFNWPDKKKSVLLANAPNYNTLRPCVEESVNFDTTENLYIEGDNLDVLKLLQETYLGKVKMIYIDPPYNTGKDFVYADDFKQSVDEYMELTDQYDEDGNRMFENKDTNGRFHTDWLNMIYPRLRLARDLLRDDGVIFISIDDNEVANLRKICDEVFGERNFVACLVWEKKKKGAFLSKAITNMKEYIFIYSKNISFFEGLIGEVNSEVETYPCVNASNKREIRNIPAGIESKYKEEEFFLPKGYKISDTTMNIVLQSDLVIQSGRLAQELILEGNWRYSQETMLQYAKANELYITRDLYLRRIVSEPRKKTLKDLLPRVGDNPKIAYDVAVDLNNLFESGWGSNEDADEELRKLMGVQKLMDYPKPIRLLQKFIVSIRDKGSIILDFFSGSATTAHAVMQLNAEDGGNRKFIMVQLPEVCDEKSEAFKAGYENICEIGKERIRRAGEKIKTETLEFNKKIKDDTAPRKVPDIGFRVLKCDSTNMKDVYYYPQDVDQNQLDMLTDNIKDDRTPEDLLFQVMLDLGVPLSCKIESELVDARKIFVVYQGDIVYLIACFDEKVSSEVVTAIAKQKPYYAVFRDSSMESDSVMTSFEQIFEAYSKDTVRKVL